jgi:hypothetical protein
MITNCRHINSTRFPINLFMDLWSQLWGNMCLAKWIDDILKWISSLVRLSNTHAAKLSANPKTELFMTWFICSTICPHYNSSKFSCMKVHCIANISLSLVSCPAFVNLLPWNNSGKNTLVFSCKSGSTG